MRTQAMDALKTVSLTTDDILKWTTQTWLKS